jgi:hypothetical protein
MKFERFTWTLGTILCWLNIIGHSIMGDGQWVAWTTASIASTMYTLTLYDVI